MTILLTGAGGQVGREVARLAPALGVEVAAFDRAALDVTDADAVRRRVADAAPDAVVNAAAYTAVDRAEAEPDLAFAVNRDGARHLAEAASERGVPVVHVSTDYVFDGTQGAPYEPGDPVAPLGVYGASKAAGEDAVRAATDRHVILRTAWVFSRYGGNFVATMLRLAGERDRLAVVADQWGHPTAAADVARACLAAARRAAEGLAGTLHVAGTPLATWHDLAAETVRLGVGLGAVPRVPVDPIPTSAYPTPAARPGRVELAMAGSFAALGLPPFDWRTALADEVAARVASGAVARADGR